MRLSDAEIERYARQVVMPELGEDGQKKLLEARVLILGAGGLGAPVIAGLAGAGAEHLTILDEDIIDTANLNRQFIHKTDNLSQPKSASAARFYPASKSRYFCTKPTCYVLQAKNADALVDAHDLVIDCTDNPKPDIWPMPSASA